MTTMSESGTQHAGPTTFRHRSLRRSTTDRVISGVSGGLGQYFGVDPVIFRVLFAVLSFFGGVGLLAYGVAWLLIPEPDADAAAGQGAARAARPQGAAVAGLLGGALVVWLAWFSWWAPDAAGRAAAGRGGAGADAPAGEAAAAGRRGLRRVGRRSPRRPVP